VGQQFCPSFEQLLRWGKALLFGNFRNFSQYLQDSPVSWRQSAPNGEWLCVVPGMCHRSCNLSARQIIAAGPGTGKEPSANFWDGADDPGRLSETDSGS
jgi:hypothetical protein